MNVKVKMKAQVNIFKDYEVEWGHFAVDLVNKKIPLKNLVERDFGPNLDGVGALHDLSFIEKEKLNQGLQMVKEYLIRISRLVKQGENFEDIKKTLEQNSVQLTPIGVSTLKNHTPVVPKFIPLLKIKKEILDKYNIKEEHLLEEAVELIQNNTHRLIYKYTYGIGIKRLLKEKILDLLDIDEMEYKQALLQVQQELSSLIEEALKNREALTEYNQIRSESKQPVKKKASSRKGKESVKPVEKIDNSKGQVVENEESHAVENNQEETSEKKERGDCVKKDNFLDYFTSIDTSDLEKEKIYHTISYFIENYVQKNDKGYQVAQSLYGKTLMEKISVSNMSMEERNNFFYFISTIKNYVKTGKIKRRPIHFIAYFISPNMSEEEKRKVEETVYKMIEQLPKDTLYYQAGETLYGQNLRGNYTNISLDHNMSSYFSFLVKFINKNLESCQKGNTFEVKRGKKGKDYFIDEFISSASEEEKEQVIHKINYFIKTYLPEEHVGYKHAKMLYGENLMQKRKNISIDGQFYYCFRLLIQGYLDGKASKYRPLQFIDYFTSFNTSEEERKEIEGIVYSIIKQLRKDTICYQAGVKLYGKDFSHLQNNIDLSPREAADFRIFIKNIQKKLADFQQIGNINSVKSKNRQQGRDYFIDYILPLDASKEEKEKTYNLISYFIENYVKQDSPGYTVAQSLYGKTLMEKISVSNMSMEERNNFFYFISTVKNYVKTGKINRRPIHFIAYFISPNMSEEMRNKTKEQVDEILKEINKENIYYKIGLKLYGEDLKELQENVKLSQPETVSFNSFIQVIKIKLQSIENNNLNFRKNKFIDETASPNRYVNGKEVDSASLLSAIQNLEFLENKEEVIELVLTDYPMYFNQLLHSAYFHILFDILTKQEGELVYLKLLQRVGVKFTDEEISKITGLTLEEISTYQIMTKEDTLNQINQYIKRK